MLKLLLATRLRYYRNFLRAHFDRITLIELGLVFLILIFLSLRSPADIGYSLNFLLAPEFPQAWAARWTQWLPLFYGFAFIAAFMTLRNTNETQLLGTLPIAPHALLPYHLFRQLNKTAGVLVLSSALFMLGARAWYLSLAHALNALAAMLVLQLLAFMQAYRWRSLLSFSSNTLGRIGAALLFEVALIATLIIGRAHLQVGTQSLAAASGRLSLTLLALAGLWRLVRRVYNPARLMEPQAKISTRWLRHKRAATAPLALIGASKHFIVAQIKRDLLFLRRQKSSLLYLLGGVTVLLLLITSAQRQAVHAFSSALFVQILYGALMINALGVLFEEDAPRLGLLRALPVEAAQLWRARWLLAFGLITVPLLIPTVIIAVKFGISFALGLFVFAAWLLLPAIYALLLCNAAFGMFPHTKLAAVLMNVFAVLILLFWFYMPFGSIILLGFTLTRVGKAQRHFQLLQVE